MKIVWFKEQLFLIWNVTPPSPSHLLLTKNRQAALTVGVSGNLMDRIPAEKQERIFLKPCILEFCKERCPALMLTWVKQSFDVQLGRRVQVWTPFKNLNVWQTKSSCDVFSYWLCFNAPSTNLSVEVHEWLCDVRMIPWTCRVTRRAQRLSPSVESLKIASTCLQRSKLY